MSLSDGLAPSESGWFASTISILFDVPTYSHLLYLLLAFPVGLLYYFFVGFGLTFGLILTVVLIGIIVLAATVGLVRLFAELERRLANALLSTELAPTDDVAEADGSVLGTAKGYVYAPSTWRG